MKTFRHAFVLLVTTVLASLADRDYLKGRRNAYNSNANLNQYSGYDGMREREMDNFKGSRYPSQAQYGQMIARPQPQRQFVPGDVGPPRYGGSPYGIGGTGKMRYDMRDRNSDFGDFCDDADPNLIARKLPMYRDDDTDEDVGRNRNLPTRPANQFAANINSNSNNNIIGLKSRRLSQWKPFFYPAPPSYGKYDNIPAAYDDRLNAQAYGDFDRSASYPNPGNVDARYRMPDMGVPDYPRQPQPPPSWPGRAVASDQDYELMRPVSSQNLNLNSNTNFIGRQGYNDDPTGPINHSRPRRSVERGSSDPSVDKNSDE